MNIHLFCPRYLYAGGGSVLYTRRIAEELSQRGHRVTLVTDRPDQPAKHPEPPPAGCTLRELNRDRSAEQAAQRWLNLANRRGFHRVSKWLNASGRRQLIAAGPWCPDLMEPRHFKEADAFVAVNTGSTAWGELLRHTLAWRQNKVRVAIPLFHPREEFASYEHHDETHLQVDRVGTLSDYERTFLITRGWPEDCITTLGAGSDPHPNPDPSFRSRHGIAADAPLVLFLGRKIFNKGLPHVISAMDAVWDRLPSARLVIAGFTHNPPAWLDEQLSRCRNPARDRTINLDDIPDAERESALSACDLVAAPSISDSFGIVYLDAWRYAKPVIACRDTCCETVIRDGETGLLVPFGDTNAISSSILRLLEKPDAARAMGEAGRKLWNEQYQWAHVTDRLETLMKSVATAKGLSWA